MWVPDLVDRKGSAGQWAHSRRRRQGVAAHRPVFDESEIAIKAIERNDLNQPGNQDLLSPPNRVRAIITRQALPEGWDCHFAYVLCALAATSNLSAMTQLVGRILRQPHAKRTGVAALRHCSSEPSLPGTSSFACGWAVETGECRWRSPQPQPPARFPTASNGTTTRPPGKSSWSSTTG